MKKISFLLVVLMVVLAGCDKEVDVRYDYYTVETGEATDVTETSAEIPCRMIANNVPDTDRRHFGVMMSERADQVTDAHATFVKTTEVDSQGNFNVHLGSLTHGITYYYRAYVYYRSKYYYGEVKQFHTEGDEPL